VNKKQRIAIAISVVVILSYFILNAVVESYLKNLIINQVELKSNGSYNLTIDQFRLSLIKRSLVAEGLSFVQRDTDASNYRSKEIRINQIDLIDLFINKKINIGSIELDKSVMIIKPGKVKTDDASNSTDSAQFFFYDLMKDKFKSLTIKEIEINNPHIMF
jgi:hypothetical protein